MQHNKWIVNESEEWVKEEIITEQQREIIVSRYAAVKKGNPLIIFFAIIGSLLIGAGIIMIFAVNWYKLPVPVKISISFIPLLAAFALCVFTALKKYKSAAYKECSAIFLSLSFFAVTALIGQTFHTAVDMRGYFLVCAVFTLPAAYIFRSKTALSIYTACYTYAAFSSLPISLVLLAAALPLFYFEIKQSKINALSGYLLTLAAIMFSYCISAVFDTVFGDSYITETVAFSIAVVYLILDEVLHKISNSYFLTPVKVMGIYSISFLLALLSFDMLPMNVYLSSVIPILILCGVYAALRAKNYKGMKSGDLFAAAALLFMIFAPFFSVISANILTIGLGIIFIVRGSRKLRVAYINTGMFLVMFIIIGRFFDSELDLLIKGIVFILLGIVFLIANFAISRKRKEQNL
ncbi:MAG: DUF2157 domain-containing protein [Clostridiales bacterium]|nr:DUF2157 domain-containing protein [Clostridiales bacterium]